MYILCHATLSSNAIFQHSSLVRDFSLISSSWQEKEFRRESKLSKNSLSSSTTVWLWINKDNERMKAKQRKTKQEKTRKKNLHVDYRKRLHRRNFFCHDPPFSSFNTRLWKMATTQPLSPKKLQFVSFFFLCIVWVIVIIGHLHPLGRAFINAFGVMNMSYFLFICIYYLFKKR